MSLSGALASQTTATRPSRFRFTENAERWRADDVPACGYAWRARPARASLVLVHGLQSHAQWFSDAAEDLLDRGVSVYAPDRRGSGSSPGGRGDIEDYRQWLEEIAAAVALARSEQPGVPVHLAGHCFGANLALGYCLTRPAEVSSLVMLTPGLYVRPDYTPVEKFAILTSGAAAGSRRFRVPQRDEMFTRDAETLEWIKGDSLGARTLTARCLLQMARMGRWLRRDLGGLGVPLLVIAANRDRIADNRRSRRLLESKLGSRHEWMTFDGEHFLLAEPCRDQVIQAMVGWISPGSIDSQGANRDPGTPEHAAAVRSTFPANTSDSGAVHRRQGVVVDRRIGPSWEVR